MDEELKFRVVRLFLRFLEKYATLKQVVIASMGGEGKEAEIWQEEGIPGTNGWLVENKRSLSKKLIETSYTFQPSLGTLVKAIRSTYGEHHGLDALHLDLNGTLESKVRIARPIIPLVVKGKVRCLAITVTDSRQNPSVRRFGKVEREMDDLLGDVRYTELLTQLQSEHDENSEYTVKCEIGFFLAITKLFKFFGRYAVPDKVLRFSYYSRTSGRPYRMRTYFFHLRNQKRRMTDRGFARLLYRVWFEQGLEDFTNRRPAMPSAPKEQGTMKMAHVIVGASRFEMLKNIAYAADLQEEFDFMHAAVQKNGTGGEKLDRLVAGLQQLLSEVVEESKGTASDKPAGRRSGNRAGSRRKARRKSAAEVNGNGQKLAAQVELILAKAKDKKTYDKVRRQVGRRFMKKGSTPELVARAMYATTRGTNRESFLKRLDQAHPELFTEQLAAAMETTLAELRAEVGI